MSVFLRNFKKQVIDSRLLISLAAVCLYACTVKITHIPFDLLYACLVFMSTLFVYNIPVFINRKAGPVTIRTGFMLLIFIGANAWAVLHKVPLVYGWLSSIMLAFCVLLYYQPFTKINLRTIPYLKIVVISGCWSVATVLVPLWLSADPETGLFFWFLALERFLFIFSITLPFDIRDLEQDKRFGLKTIPGTIGVRNSVMLSSGLLAFYILLTIFYYGPGPLLYSRIICSVFVFILLKNLRPGLPTHYYTGLIDGSMILQFVLLYSFTEIHLGGFAK